MARPLGGQVDFPARFAEADPGATNDSRTMTVIVDDLGCCWPGEVAQMLVALNFLTSAGQCCVIEVDLMLCCGPTMMAGRLGGQLATALEALSVVDLPPFVPRQDSAEQFPALLEEASVPA